MSHNHYLERLIEFSNFSLKLAMKSTHYYEKIDLIPESANNKGKIYFSLNTNKKNRRGWKITLNKVNFLLFHEIYNNQRNLTKIIIILIIIRFIYLIIYFIIILAEQ